MISDPNSFANTGFETETDLDFVNTFGNDANTLLDTTDNATSFAGITHEVEPELEVISSASSRFLFPIAPRLHNERHRDRITPIDDFAADVSITNGVGYKIRYSDELIASNTHDMEIVPTQRRRDLSTPRKLRCLLHRSSTQI